jgi:hypothetical protein
MFLSAVVWLFPGADYVFSIFQCSIFIWIEAVEKT